MGNRQDIAMCPSQYFKTEPMNCTYHDGIFFFLYDERQVPNQRATVLDCSNLDRSIERTRVVCCLTVSRAHRTSQGSSMRGDQFATVSKEVRIQDSSSHVNYVMIHSVAIKSFTVNLTHKVN
jgi:hypothetical protein